MEDSDQVADGDPVGEADMVGGEDPVEDVKQAVNVFHDVRMHDTWSARVHVGHFDLAFVVRVNNLVLFASFIFSPKYHRRRFQHFWLMCILQYLANIYLANVYSIYLTLKVVVAWW